MGRNCGDGASNLVLQWTWGLCVVISLVSLANPTSGQAADAGCSGDLTNKVTKFKTQNLICKQYKFPSSTPYVIWALRDNSTQVVTMVASMPLSANKWAGLAFSVDGQMRGASALIASLGSSGAPSTNQYSLKEKTRAGVVKGGQGMALVGGAPEAYYEQGKTVYMAFQVDVAKSTAKPKYLLVAHGALGTDGSPDYHEEKSVFNADLISGSVAGDSASSQHEKKKKIHGIFQVLGWGLLLPIGALVARYARFFETAWFYTHIYFQLVGFACIIGGVVTGLQLAKGFQHDHLLAHRGLGFFLLTLAFLQVLAVVLRPKKDSKVRQYWNWYHAGLGRFALFLAVINTFLGLTMAEAENSFKAAYIAILSMEFLTFVVLEVWYWRRWSRQPPPQGQPPSQEPPAFQFGGTV